MRRFKLGDRSRLVSDRLGQWVSYSQHRQEIEKRDQEIRALKLTVRALQSDLNRGSS